jgi:hypothetical protein
LPVVQVGLGCLPAVDWILINFIASYMKHLRGDTFCYLPFARNEQTLVWVHAMLALDGEKQAPLQSASLDYIDYKYQW